MNKQLLTLLDLQINLDAFYNVTIHETSISIQGKKTEKTLMEVSKINISLKKRVVKGLVNQKDWLYFETKEVDSFGCPKIKIILTP